MDAFKSYQVEVEKQLNKKIKVVWSDREREYYGRMDRDCVNHGEYMEYLREQDIVSHYTTLGTPK